MFVMNCLNCHSVLKLYNYIGRGVYRKSKSKKSPSLLSIKIHQSSTEHFPTMRDSGSISSTDQSNQFKIKKWPIDNNLTEEYLRSIFEEINEHSIQLPCTIFEGVTLDQFFPISEKEERLFHFLEYNETNQEVSIVEMPSKQHQVLLNVMTCSLCSRYMNFIQCGLSNVYHDVTNTKRWKEPDQSLSLRGLEKLPCFDAYKDALGKIAPNFVIEVSKSSSFQTKVMKFHDYFRLEGCRVGLVIDIKNNDIRMAKILRNRENPQELEIFNSVNGRITISPEEIYPRGYVYKKKKIEQLPVIEIDLKKSEFNLPWNLDYKDYTMDGQVREGEQSSSDDSD